MSENTFGEFDEEPVTPADETPAGVADGAGDEPGVSPEAPPPDPVPAEVEVASEPEPVEETPAPVKKPRKKAAAKRTGAKGEPSGNETEPYYVALKVFRVPGREVRPGEKVPEAKGWLRPEGYVRLGYIKLVDPNA